MIHIKNNLITPEQQLRIIEYYRFNKENQSHIIAVKFNVAVHQIESIINKYLAQKTKY